MNKHQKIAFIFSIIFGILYFYSIHLVSANGLQVLNNSNFSITKLVGVPYTLNLQLQNQEGYQFFNISVDNNVINFPIINLINSGSILNITSNIITNENFNGQVRIKGFYTAQIGNSNITHLVNIYFPDGTDVCDMTITKGDRVVWKNNVVDDIKLKNEDTQNDITTIAQGGNYSILFDSPGVLNYAPYRTGYRINNVICRITILNDNGLVNNPELDAIINLNVQNTYDPTNITSSVIDNNFTMNFYDSTEGVLTIKNTGNKVAKNVQLSGEWLTFNKNNFDLALNEQKVVVFTIKPQISGTNDTNKTTIKIININGNFPLNTQNINVFLNYANVNEGSFNNTNLTGADAIVAYICSVRPDLCNPQPSVVYRYIGNTTNQNVTTSFGLDQLKSWIELQFGVKDDVSSALKYIKSNDENKTQLIVQMSTEMSDMKARIASMEESNTKSNSNNSFLLYIIPGGLIIVILIVIVFMLVLRNRKRKLAQ